MADEFGAWRGSDGCADCGLPYSDFGMDVTLPHSQWALIAPEGGILCANCMVQRATTRIEGVIVARMAFKTGDDVDGNSYNVVD